MAATCDEIHVPSTLSKLKGIITSASADSSLKLGGLEELPEWQGLPPSQDEVIIKLSSANAASDPVLITEAVHHKAALSKSKMYVITTISILPNKGDNLWYNK